MLREITGNGPMVRAIGHYLLQCQEMKNEQTHSWAMAGAVSWQL